jgi:hypothetical protein
MDDAKEHPPPGANRGRASKERSKNRATCLPQPHERGQLGDDGSRAFEATFERDCEYSKLKRRMSVRRALDLMRQPDAKLVALREQGSGRGFYIQRPTARS